MKALFQKEWREHFKLAVVGLAVFSLFLAWDYWDCGQAMKQVAEGSQMSGRIDFAQPLLAGETFVWVGAYCAIFGAVLGWLQIYSERHRDLWAFLVHRPITRTHIFFGKVLAGLCLYALAAGLPLVVFIILVRLPGHFAAPFEWAMALPVLTFFLIGTVFYFAGLLTAARQARWYASRGLGLAASIMMMLVAVNAPFFGLALLVILVSAAILAGAACGSFNTHGFYEGQRPLNRRALVIALTLGCCGVLIVVFIILAKPFDQWTSESTDYEMTRDGTIYKVTSRSSYPGNLNHRTKITDLKGIPLKDKKTGLPISSEEFGKLTAWSFGVPLNFNAKPQPHRGFFSQDDFFSLWRQTPDTLWYWERNGRLWAYDIATRRFIGSLGPNGFAPGGSYGAGRFNPPAGWINPPAGWNYGRSHPVRTLTAGATVYKLDLEKRACQVLFAGTNDEPILGAVDYARDNDHRDGTIVATKSFIRMITPEGQCAWQIPFEPAYPAYKGVTVSCLEPTNQFAVWIIPSSADKKLPTHVVWVTEDEGILKSADVPQNQFAMTRPWINRAVDAIVPPATFFIAPLVQDDLAEYRVLPWKDIRISFAAALVCGAAGWVLGRRNYFSAGWQVSWAVFLIFSGLPGLLALICAQEWVVRVPCPNCRKPRAVDRDRCVHCGAEFAPPAKIGTEIFETVARQPLE